ncbi:hypothetical protein C8Q72DRAFT_305402 [Fomitopsis betulina]|nr:hypothetical protein C8Q72DRAFT_305402 [Fomitopsis betulina]
MRTATGFILALVASASAMYSSVEGMYARNLDEELYTRDLEAIPYQTGHGGRSGLSTVGAAVAARGINAALEMYRERSDEDLYGRDFDEDLYARELESWHKIVQAVSALRERSSEQDLYEREFRRTILRGAKKAGRVVAPAATVASAAAILRPQPQPHVHLTKAFPMG